MTDPRAIWAADDAHLPPLSPADLRGRDARFRRRVRRRNLVEYVAGGVVVALFGAIGARAQDGLFRIACAAIVLGVVAVLFSLRRRGAAHRPDDAVPVRDHYRAELSRQRDALASVWRWYLAPLVPGLALLFAARWREVAGDVGIGVANARILPAIVVTIGVFGGIHWLNRVGARRLDGEIAKLDESDQED